MKANTSWISIGKVALASLLVLADELFKRNAVRSFPNEADVRAWHWLTLAVHRNYGILFDIPLKRTAVIVLSAGMILFLAFFAGRRWNTERETSIAAVFILLGALGNLFDRVAYGFTVDYLILFGRSAVNLSDGLILLGILLFLLNGKQANLAHSQEKTV